jgi:hypothetical protein
MLGTLAKAITIKIGGYRQVEKRAPRSGQRALWLAMRSASGYDPGVSGLVLAALAVAFVGDERGGALAGG